MTISNFPAHKLPLYSKFYFFRVFIMDYKYFTWNDDGMSIEEYLEERRSKWKTSWQNRVSLYLQDDVEVWWNSLNHEKMETLSDDEFEQVYFRKVVAFQEERYRDP